jgi:hypothetical protein
LRSFPSADVPEQRRTHASNVAVAFIGVSRCIGLLSTA